MFVGTSLTGTGPRAGVTIIHSLQKYSLHAYFVPGTVSGAETLAVTSKTDKNHVLLEPSFYHTSWTTS